ncbi:hypothetical protein Tco_0824794 [Tanacetum coccineum]
MASCHHAIELYQLIVNVVFLWSNVLLGLILTNVEGRKNCNALYWIDPEMYNQWYAWKLEGMNTCNNDKSLSEIQPEHKKEDEFVVVVVVKVEIESLEGNEGEYFWEEGDDFGVDVLCFHTCLTDILGFLEKFRW